ncbi:serine/threonine-protein kinase pakF [Hyalella azteca]|uniref:Serine/threonine-protein kinase pakF n=1 Tax=Hyalella azteca TaxID=294128 RepID=A0A8B7PBE1_HYAAZ|nr:serine/threonine-protein kinase pakF [Hyalella azteca]
MYGNFGRRSPSPMRNQVSGLRRGSGRLVGIIPPPPPPPPPSEPDRDEAFVQETGIKVYTSMPSRTAKRREDANPEGELNPSHDDEEDENEDDDDDDGDEGDVADDDCYEIIMDDAIIEEDNEDDDDDGDYEHHSKSKIASTAKTHTNGTKPLLSVATESCDTKEVLENAENINNQLRSDNLVAPADSVSSSGATNSFSRNKSSSGVSSNDSSSGVLHGSGNDCTEAIPSVKIPDSQEHSKVISPIDVGNPRSLQQGNSSEGSGSDMSRSSSNGSHNSVKINTTLSSSLKGLNLITSPTTTTAPTQPYAPLSTHCTPTKENNPSEFLVRGKPNRMSLPLRDRFIARPTVLQDNSNSATGDVRAKDGTLRATRTIWFRRSFKNPTADTSGAAVTSSAAGTAKLQQLQQHKARDVGKLILSHTDTRDDFDIYSHVHNETETNDIFADTRTTVVGSSSCVVVGDSRLRHRRKSGDDIHKLATADATLCNQSIGGTPFGGRRRHEGGFFDSFRPRSKSDAKAILQARQRRRSGEDLLTASGAREAPAAAGSREKKKEASPGFFESIRPRSKSDAARLANKKPNIMTTMKNAVQLWNEDKERRKRERDALRRERQMLLGRFSQSCQHTLVSPGGGVGSGRGQRRSGESTPPLDARMGMTVHHGGGGGGGDPYLHHNTWHAGGAVWALFD